MDSAAGRHSPLSETQVLGRQASQKMARKIWLPKLAYDALPYFYLLAGLIALATTVFVNDWLWVVPHYLLFSATCIHMGFMVYRRRHRDKSAEQETTDG